MNRYLGWREVVRHLGISRTTLWRWLRTGQFPTPVRLGPGRVAFRESDIREWEDAREKVEYGAAQEAP